jgi:hypothetical protein
VTKLETFGGNPSERLNPSFTLDDEEAGVPEELAPVVMAPPGYASPDPATSGVPLLPLEDSPLSADLSEDYAADEISAGAKTSHATTLSGNAMSGFPADRDEWDKAMWQIAAKQHGLSTKGSANALRDRVEEHEASMEASADKKAGDWIADVEGAEGADALEDVKAQYEESGADFKTVSEAIEKKQAELDENEA